jgi:hypothetical protein
MHEVAHGLGFQNFANEATGALPDGLPDVYMASTLDLDLDDTWNHFTTAEIKASAINNGRVVWAGPHVTANAPLVLGPYEGIRLTGGVNREIEYGPASFGAVPSASTFGGQVALATYGAGATDGCSPITSPIAGKVALVDRGTCTFTVKAKNAQNAGAKAVMIANSVAGGSAAFSPGGSDPTVTIATIGISITDGNAIKAAATPVTAEYFVDPSRRAGMAEGFVRLYAPRVVALGSSISHFDVTAKPDLLMEPFSTPGTRANVNLDLTPALMQDIGWGIETLKIGNCDTGVPTVLATGQMLHANVSACAAGAKNHGQFVSCMNGIENAARDSGLLSNSQRNAIHSCAAHYKP